MKRYKGLLFTDVHGLPRCRVVVQELEANLVAEELVPKKKNESPLTHHPHHSPDGHSWGYLGSGPAELAKDILWDFLGQEPAPVVYQTFKEDYVAHWPQDDQWTLDAPDVEQWLWDYRHRCAQCSHDWGAHLIDGTGTVFCPVPNCDCVGARKLT